MVFIFRLAHMLLLKLCPVYGNHKNLKLSNEEIPLSHVRTSSIILNDELYIQ